MNWSDRERMRLQMEAENDPDWIAAQRCCLFVFLFLVLAVIGAGIYFLIHGI